MKSSTILGLAMLAALLAAAPEQALSRGGGGGGGGRGGDFGGGDRGYSGGDDSWHGGGSDAVGGTWHNDGYHADAYYSGYGGAAAVNHYYANGCYNCGGREAGLGLGHRPGDGLRDRNDGGDAAVECGVPA